PQKDGACNRDPPRRLDAIQHYEKDRGNLRKRVGLPENAGPEITESSDGIQHGAGGKNGNVAAEDQHSKLPRNLVQNREHREHRAQQELVFDGIEILAEQSLLVQLAGQQAIQAVAESSDHEENQGPAITAVDQFVHDNRNENHPQQRKLVRRGKDL